MTSPLCSRFKASVRTSSKLTKYFIDMFSASKMFSRTALTARSTLARTTPCRAFSTEGVVNKHHHPPASLQEISKWRMGSYAAGAFCVAMGVVIFALEDHKHHHHPAYPYLRIRKKAFPWKNGDCDLIHDTTCERAGQAASSAH